MKNLIRIILIIASVGTFTACTSPEEKAAAYIENGNTLLEQGNLDKAALEYRNALQVNANLPDALFGLAQIGERKQEWAKVFSLLNKVRELQPNHIETRIKLAQLLLASNQLDKALLDAREILELAPGDARGHSLMAAVLFRLGSIDKAKVEVSNALSADPTNQEAKLVLARIFISQEKYKEAHEVLDKAIAQVPGNVSMYLMKIEAFEKAGDRKGVESVFISLIDKFPDNLAYQVSLARLYSENKETDKAEKILLKIVSKNPENVEEKIRLAQFTRQNRSLDAAIKLLKDYAKNDTAGFRFKFLLAQFYESSNKTAEASAVYQEVINTDGLQPAGLQARNSLALLELASGNVDKAKQLMNEVLAHEKSNENALLMQAYFKLTAKQYDDAIIDVRTVLRDNPDSVKALSLLARAHQAKGSEELAFKSYLKAYKINPTLPLLANRLAQYHIQNNQFDDANKILEESFRRGNRSAESLKIFAQVKVALQDWEAAEKIAKLLKQTEGQEALSQQMLGIAYQGQEQHEESIKAFKEAHKLAPSASQPIVALVRIYSNAGKLEEAKKFLNSIIAVDASNVAAYTLLGQLSLQENQPEQAKKYFRKAVDINPRLTIGYRSLARIHMTDNRPEIAEKVIMEGLAAAPGDTVLTMTLASIYEKKLQFEKAISLYETLLDKNSDILIAKNNLASLLTDHRTDEASLSKARDLASEFKDSKIPYFRDTYAWASLNAGASVEESVVILEDIVKESEKTAVFNYHLGMAYLKQGDKSRASQHLLKAVEYSGADTALADQAKKGLLLVAQ